VPEFERAWDIWGTKHKLSCMGPQTRIIAEMYIYCDVSYSCHVDRQRDGAAHSLENLYLASNFESEHPVGTPQVSSG
jgi:hypothetical protein